MPKNLSRYHAEKSLAMGFCLFNNIAFAALHAIEQSGLSHVPIIDFDVHNGNGTVDIFNDDARVMACTLFQHPFYTNRHFDTAGEHLILSPINVTSTGIVFRKKVEQKFLPALNEFRLELFLISAGFDTHAKDPLGKLNPVEDDYRWLDHDLN